LRRSNAENLWLRPDLREQVGSAARLIEKGVVCWLPWMGAARLAALRVVAATEILDLTGCELALDFTGRLKLESANDFAWLMDGLWWCFRWRRGAGGEREDSAKKADLAEHN